MLQSMGSQSQTRLSGRTPPPPRDQQSRKTKQGRSEQLSKGDPRVPALGWELALARIGRFR